MLAFTISLENDAHMALLFITIFLLTFVPAIAMDSDSDFMKGLVALVIIASGAMAIIAVIRLIAQTL